MARAVSGAGTRTISLKGRSAARPQLLLILYPVLDVVAVWLAASAVFYSRFAFEINVQVLEEYLGLLVLYTALIVLSCESQNLYRLRPQSTFDQVAAVVKAVTLATLLLVLALYLLNIKSMSRLVLVATGLSAVVLLAGWRLWAVRNMQKRLAAGQGAHHALIAGAGPSGRALAQYLQSNRALGFSVKGFIDDAAEDGQPLLGGFEQLAEVARANFIDEVFITTASDRQLVRRLAFEARRQRLNVRVLPDLYDLGWNPTLDYVGEFPMLGLHEEPIPEFGLLVKRAMDISLAWTGLMVAAPVMLGAAIAIKLSSPGPVLYRSQRIGKKGQPFTFYKFRSMVADADAHKEALRAAANEREGPFFKMAQDPRITRVGRFLRRYSLDELPQLWNVVKGDMSMVGPRPHPLDDCEQYTLEHLRRLDVTPGITGLWQVSARRDPSFETNMRLDLEYIEQWSLWLDLKILWRTVPAALRGV